MSEQVGSGHSERSNQPNPGNQLAAVIPNPENPQTTRDGQSDTTTNKCRERWPSWNAIATTAATLVIAGATIAGVFVAAKQWKALHSTDEAVRSQVQVMKGQLTEMRASGEQTKEMINLTKGQMRSYITIVPETVFHADDKGSPLEAYVAIKNSGQTPARDIQRFMGLRVLASYPKNVSELGEMIADPGHALLGREQAMHIHIISRHQLTTDEATAIRQGKLRIIVFGKVSHTDVFRDKWDDEFCFEYSGNGIDSAPGEYLYPGSTALPCQKR